ncbi:MAG: adenylate/guanylate cyclase domain-containing protein [Maribacter arcticus]|uniref:adenylate/guanylate cyclase domain-containing protein n=1 Tax=Maribacter arcticus TaxID=561365 RepID=UPI0030012EC4
MTRRKLIYYYLIGFFCSIGQNITAQDQRIADSLVEIFKADTLEGVARLELLNQLSFNEINDFDKKLDYAEKLITIAKQEKQIRYQYHGYYLKGDAKQFVGDLQHALIAYFKSAEIAKNEQLIAAEGNAYGAIADIYTMTDNHNNAMLYYDKAITTLRRTKDSVSLGVFIMNAGDALLTNKKYDSAIIYFKESGALFDKIKYDIGKAYNLGNIGMAYANTGQGDLAESNINNAIRILQESEDYYHISVYLMAMADIYLEKEQHQTAIDYTQRSLTIAEQYGLKEQIVDAHKKLAELYQIDGNPITSYIHYKDYIKYRDELNNIEIVQKLADERTKFEVSQKQNEVDLAELREENQRNIAIGTAIALFLIGLLTVGLYRRSNFIRKTKQIFELERDLSDKLLLNILPEETATELKTCGKVKAKKYDTVTVLFTDFKGFTSYSENLSPEALVETIGFYFSKFDDIIEKHGLEKIKTIGDGYMCAGGLHGNTINHANRMILAAFEIAAFVKQTKDDVTASELTFDIRIGINTGPVVAGVVGNKKFAYDIWGDTVNVASRMESMSEPGRINISENTYHLVCKDFDCVPRGEIQMKNHGMMQMFYVIGIKTIHRNKNLVSI